MLLGVFTLLLLAPALLTSHPLMGPPREPTCGYQACNPVKPGLLNVHLVPHSHDDVGWLKSFDQYYFGSKTNIQRAGVQYILNSVVNELSLNEERRFIQVETAFLWKWWQEQSESRRKQVRHLVNTGRLEITGGAWSMNDEAAVHYQSVVDQFTWGFRKLDEMFGNCSRPRVGWQIDPFGHSREMASIFSQLGFDGVFFARLDYQDKKNRLATKTAEMLWAGSPTNLGESANLFTTALYNHYSAPAGFCFDVLCNDEPIIDNARSTDYNVDRKVQDFIQFCQQQAQYYNTDNIIVTMGDDFNYQDATMNFKNMDKLIRYVNAKQKSGGTVNVFYSTPSCYVKAVNDANLTWSVKEDDFFPYASDAHAYWTGYFTSRPTSKYFERQGNNYLQVCKQLSALAGVGESGLAPLREAMGVMQHHDAITGTEKQKVADDYHRILHAAIMQCERVIETAINKLATPASRHSKAGGRGTPLTLDSCLLSNVSQCAVSENSSSFVATVYNPLSHPVTHYVRLPITGGAYSVVDPSGEEQLVQMVPIPVPVVQLPERTSKATTELVFRAQDLPPLGFRSYYITRLGDSGRKEVGEAEEENKEIADEEVSTVIGNERIQVELDEGSGVVQGIVIDGVHIPLRQDFHYYEGFGRVGYGEQDRPSGAYVFRPQGADPISVANDSDITSTIYRGDLVEEVHQQFSDWVSQVVRVYKGENHVEFEWLVGPIPVSDRVGKEVISRWSSELASEGAFHTDSNGRELLRRVRDQRPTWDADIQEAVAGNYYPVTSKILVRDEDKQQELAVLTDRAQGGSSLHDGQVELMVHRRLLYDDGFGVGEALDETAFRRGLVARGRHWLVAGARHGAAGVSLAAEERELAQRKLLSPRVFLSPAEGTSFQRWSAIYNMEFSGLKEALPSNVQVLTLEPWKNGTLLLRLEHILETGEDPDLSQPATVDLENLFAPFSLVSADETTLGANQLVTESQRLSWRPNQQQQQQQHPSSSSYSPERSTLITLTPMQIRTFIIRVK